MMKKIKPGPGQESVWDYPRPPRIERFNGSIEIVFNSEIIFRGNQSFRILETSHPPTYYLPLHDFAAGVVIPVAGNSFCEFKGMAAYFSIQVGDRTAEKSAWGYANPMEPYEALKDHIALYAHEMDQCLVNGEAVQAQPGDFYGGWITSNIVGPFKGGAGTWGW